MQIKKSCKYNFYKSLIIWVEHIGIDPMNFPNDSRDAPANCIIKK
jgi:hypothetical protein